MFAAVSHVTPDNYILFFQPPFPRVLRFCARLFDRGLALRIYLVTALTVFQMFTCLLA